MIRVTLEADPGRKINMPFGYEVTVPMSFGIVADPDQMVDFSGSRQLINAERKEWFLEWDDPDLRVTLMEEAAAIHYFGDPRARSNDDERVKNKQLPEFNQERLRVARVWGDYLYSDQHGLYSTVRIAVPKVPQVNIVPIMPNGMAMTNAPVYRPWEFFAFEALLSADHEAEMEALRRRRPRYFEAPEPQPFDISKMTPAQIAELAEKLGAYAATENSKRAAQAMADQRELNKARASNAQ